MNDRWQAGPDGTTRIRPKTQTARELGRSMLELVDVLGQWATFALRSLTTYLRDELEKEQTR